jgi:hypothetical protein
MSTEPARNDDLLLRDHRTQPHANPPFLLKLGLILAMLLALVWSAGLTWGWCVSCFPFFEFVGLSRPPAAEGADGVARTTPLLRTQSQIASKERRAPKL